jgi:multidrug resistance efflux pump
MKSNIPFYIFIGALFFGMLFVTMRFFHGSGRSTVGITEAKGYKINAEKSALIKQVHVVAGQEVKVGDLLVELSSYGLEMDIDQLQNKILSLKTEQDEKSKLFDSEIAYTRAQYDIDIEKLEAEIAKIESELKLNDQLAKDFASSSQSSDHSKDPVQLKLKSLNEQKRMHHQAINIKIADINQKGRTDQTLLNNQVKLLERQLAMFVEEKKKLNKYATFNGVIESVFVKNGEEVEAFSSLLSANPSHPTTVVGYFTGRNEREIPMGTSVTVMSYDHHEQFITGKVIGFGSVVELPQILQKSTAVKAFGREVFIEIGADNAFATGEKVLIK